MNLKKYPLSAKDQWEILPLPPITKQRRFIKFLMPSGNYTEGPYYKISTSSKGTIKVIDPTDYKYQGDNCLFYDYNGNRGHFIENGIDEKGKTTYIWQELEHNH